MTATRKHCLLVVDDEPDVGDSVYDLLRREFQVLRARSAAEGFKLIQDNEVHIVMTDQRMPQISGVELLKNLRVRHPLAIRILFTGYADFESVIAAVNQGRIFQFIKKPWQPEELVQAVRSAAEEYEQIVAHNEREAKLQAELENLRNRVAALEAEVQQLRNPEA